MKKDYTWKKNHREAPNYLKATCKFFYTNAELLTCLSSLPGGFYSDSVGYVAKSCKRCPNGSFVEFHKTPGKRQQDCKSCPLGKL